MEPIPALDVPIAVASTDKKPSYQYAATQLVMEELPADDFLLAKNDTAILSKIREVLSFEAPISESLLTRRIMQSYGIARAGARLQQKMKKLLTRMEVITTQQDGAIICWDAYQNPHTYPHFRINGSGDDRRDVKDVPVQEAANAVCHALREQFSLPQEDLIREAGKLMGYTRNGSNVIAAFEAAIELAAGQGRILQSANDHWMLCETPIEN